MTTITIKQPINLPKTEFETLEDFLSILSIDMPLELVQDSMENLSNESQEKIKQVQNSTNVKLTDFQG